MPKYIGLFELVMAYRAQQPVPVVPVAVPVALTAQQVAAMDETAGL